METVYFLNKETNFLVIATKGNVIGKSTKSVEWLFATIEIGDCVDIDKKIYRLIAEDEYWFHLTEVTNE